MDRLTDLSSTLSNLTMYDIKSMYNQAKNVVLNVSEMEAKVREATNDDPWGASSTLMTEIAQGQNFNEIMPCIYGQFMEKEAKQWRQIYKSLQLLEYLVKHGSERVVDDARSHISTLKMLRNFHYIDDKGKDQGINVRNRSRELVELLSDVEKIRLERRKAKANKNKYTGTGNDGFGLSSGGGGGGRYGGFGSDSIGSSSFSSYSSGGGGYGANASGYDREYGSGGGGSSGGFRDDLGRKGYEEYDAGDYEAPRRSSASGSRPSATTSRPTPTRSSTHPTPAPKAPEPAKEVDLLGFGDDDDQPLSIVSSGLATDKALPALSPASPSADAGDDDFADFVAAPTPPPAAPSAKPNLMDLLNSAPAARSQPPQPQTSFGSFGMMAPATQRPAQPPMYAASPPPAGMSSTPLFAQPALTPTSPPPRGSMGSPALSTSSSASAPAKKAGGFDDLWTMSLGASGNKAAAAPAGASKSIKDLEKEKAQKGLWGGARTGSGMGQPRPASMAGSAFGSFAQPSASQSTGGGADDLLL
ncbi:hypothetical protein OF83DRAFT_1162094 [Amylostereum chailletii]|nr:hypothetical protein OF83DRAFT_1162094 [Amylostereum chailletii]